MQKIFATQLSGIFNNINKDEFAIEDAARLLAQAVIGEGTIYIAGFDEMEGITAQAINGIEAFPSCKPLTNPDEVRNVDRVLLFSRTNHDPQAMQLAKHLEENGIAFVSVGTVLGDDAPGIEDIAHVHIDLKLKRGLVPTETGERIGFPSLLTALYVLHSIQFTLAELLDEYND